MQMKWWKMFWTAWEGATIIFRKASVKTSTIYHNHIVLLVSFTYLLQLEKNTTDVDLTAKVADLRAVSTGNEALDVSIEKIAHLSQYSDYFLCHWLSFLK